MATHFLNRRHLLKANRKVFNTLNGRIVLLACAVFACSVGANSAFGQTTSGPVRITLDEAIQMALQHNHNIIAARTTIDQSLAMEVTANLRPNPALFTDWEYLPLNNPAKQNPGLYTGVSTADYLHNNTEADLGLSYLIERGKKRARRYQAAKDVTAQTRSLVADNERGLTYQVSTLFVNVQLAESTIDLAQQDLKSFQQTVDIGELQFKAGGISEDNYLKIELHERISEPLPLRMADITGLIQPREPHPGLNPYPSKAALMTHLLLHAAGAMKARAARLIQLNDIARLSANMTAADWDRVLELGQAGREHWWALPPLQLTARYYSNVIPAHVLATLSANCPWLLARICRRRTLTDVSMSHMQIDAFPGIEWSQSLTESVQYAANRLWPSKELLALRKQLAQTGVAWSGSQWHRSSQARRLLRWIVSRPARDETMHTIRAALDRVR